MIFSDDDLKRLKECTHPVSGLQIGLFHPPETTMTKFDLLALLARLEAAEKVAELTYFHFFSSKGDYTNPMEKELGEASQAWRAACGK